MSTNTSAQEHLDRKQVRKVVLGVIEAYKRLRASDIRQLRRDIVEIISTGGDSRIGYRDVCLALEWLKAKRRVLLCNYDKDNAKAYEVSVRY